MMHLDEKHRLVFRDTFYSLLLFSGLLAFAIALGRIGRTEILARHSVFEISREQFNLLASIGLGVLLGYLIIVGLMACIVMLCVLLHQHTRLHKA
jgi:ABC-type uncharacterized transport system permease subunit